MGMVKVFVHHTESFNGEWTNEEREFSRVLNVGEFVALSMSGAWLRVELVVHCPFKAPVEAEVYGTRSNDAHVQAIKALG